MNLYEMLKARKVGWSNDFLTNIYAKAFGGSQPASEHEYTGAVPYTFTADGTPLLDWYINGNPVQNGTPTPSNPVDVNGVGVRTENLFDGTLLVGFYLDINTMYTDNPNYRSFRVQGLPAGQYTVSWNIPVRLVRAYYDGVMYENAGENLTSYTVTTSDGDIAFSFRNEISGAPWSDSNTVMLNTGSTAKPFEPYGYKIPILTNSQTTNVYLGEVPTTRKIIRYVVTGEENWTRESGNTYVLEGVEQTATAYANALCTHYVLATSYNTLTGTDGTFSVSKRPALFIHDENFTTATQLKTYLATQYANGTPVVIYYTLNTPTTAVVNEPLMKIGDYADTLSNAAQIPTANGINTFDVNTTVKPSEVYIKYMG